MPLPCCSLRKLTKCLLTCPSFREALLKTTLNQFVCYYKIYMNQTHLDELWDALLDFLDHGWKLGWLRCTKLWGCNFVFFCSLSCIIGAINVAVWFDFDIKLMSVTFFSCGGKGAMEEGAKPFWKVEIQVVVRPILHLLFKLIYTCTWSRATA